MFGRRQRGSVSVQMVILMPIGLFVLLLAVQAALFFQARSVAIAAAESGAEVAAWRGGTAEAGRRAAERFVADSATHIDALAVWADRSRTTATVRVRGRATSLVPGIRWSIRVAVAMPVERLTR